VVTGIEYALHPVGPEIVGGPVAWPAGDAGKVLELYRRLAEDAPPELTLVAIQRPAPPAPWLPKEWHGKPVVLILACHSGSPERAEREVAAIKNFGKPIGDVLVRRPYTQMQALLDATQPKGRRYYWKSEYVARVDPALCEKSVTHALRAPSPHDAVIFFQIGGALNGLPAEHSPAGNRDARYVLNIAGSWDRAADDKANLDWARAEDESPERVDAALGKAISRLRDVKRRWDPENVFRTNRNIQPA
jgi:hypothetical protein